MTKQIVAICNLANSPKNICAILQLVIFNFTKTEAKNLSFSIYHSKVLDDSETCFASVLPNSEIFSLVSVSAVSDLGYIESNGRMIKRTGCGLIQKLLKNLPGENHKDEERPTQFSR
jgi:hypothetical protein